MLVRINKARPKCWQGGEKEALVQCWWECKLGQPNILNSVYFQNIKTRNDPEIPVLGYLSKEYENANLKRYKHSYVHHSIIYSSQDMEPKCPSMDEWIKKMTQWNSTQP